MILRLTSASHSDLDLFYPILQLLHHNVGNVLYLGAGTLVFPSFLIFVHFPHSPYNFSQPRTRHLKLIFIDNKSVPKFVNLSENFFKEDVE